MEKLLSLLKSKKFWTLVAAIVAALTAFFTTACQYSGTLFRTGVHNDTVRYEYRVRSRNAVMSCNHSINQPISIRESSRSILSSTDFIVFATLHRWRMVSLLGRSEIPMPVSLPMCRNVSAPLSISKFLTFTESNPNFSTNLSSLSNAPSESFGTICLASLLPIGFVKRSRRGGRRGKGRPRPSTKTVTLGGSHL